MATATVFSIQVKYEVRVLELPVLYSYARTWVDRCRTRTVLVRRTGVLYEYVVRVTRCVCGGPGKRCTRNEYVVNYSYSCRPTRTSTVLYLLASRSSQLVSHFPGERLIAGQSRTRSFPSRRLRTTPSSDHAPTLLLHPGQLSLPQRTPRDADSSTTRRAQGSGATSRGSATA